MRTLFESYLNGDQQYQPDIFTDIDPYIRDKRGVTTDYGGTT